MTYLIIIAITLIFSAFFSGMEIAFISSNRLKIELERKQKTFASRIINIYSANPGKYIVTMLIGNNIALVIYGIVMATILEPYIALYVSSSTLILTIQTIISTLIILVTAEFLPKTIFRINPNASLNVFAVPVMIFYILFYPLTLFVIFLSNTIFSGVFKVRIEDKINKKPVFSKVDIDDLVNVNESVEEEEEIEHDVKIFKNALDFSKIKLRECMVPRTEIEAVDINEELENLKQRFIETGYSRIIVYRESIDDIVGYVHSAE